MSEKDKPKLRKDAIQNQMIILKEARVLFKENGIAKTSMRQIAIAAGVGQGTLYRRYAHKGELCLALLLDIAEKNCEDILTYLHEHRDASIEIRLKQTLAFSIDFIEEQCQLLSAIKSPNCEDDVTIIYHSPIYTSKHDIFRNLLEEIPCENEAQPLDTTYVADLIMAAMAPNFFLFLRDDRGYSKDDIRDNLYDACIRPLLERCNETNK